MADLLGISITAYRELEKGSTAIMNQHILKMARLTDTPTEKIVLGYLPSQAENTDKLRDIESQNTERIKFLEKRIAELEKTVSYMAETIESKNEIIAMLKKSLGEEK